LLKLTLLRQNDAKRSGLLVGWLAGWPIAGLRGWLVGWLVG
jgi:hypothetical protein